MVAAVLIFLLFFLPWLWGEEIQRAETEEPDGGSTALPETEEVPATVYDSARTLRVKIGDTVQEMDLETYLRGVVRAEMPASFELEALKAQAIAARTYTYYKMENGPSANHPDADACDDITCCQAYKSEADAAVDWGMSTAVYENKIRRAVAETDGEVVLYEGAPVLAVFHSSSAGATQNVEDVWQSSLPYLQSVDSPEGADAVPNYYSKIGEHLVLFDWVGLDNFKALFDSSSILGSTFWSVLGWTLVWAFFATFSNYIFGMIVSLLINRKGTRAKGFWRFCFVLSCAVPMFVSLLIMRTMLQPEGAINVLLRNLGLIAQDASLPFFTDPTWARVTVIIINIWVGVPYTLLQLTGVLQNIPEELYEAARVDGANAVQIFFKITLPYMLYVTTPYLITTFTGNVNNFNVIYLLSGGDPVTDVGATAGKTDLLVTWLYKLTIDKQYYNIGAVIGILTFIILAIGALITYRNSKSYKEEGGF